MPVKIPPADTGDMRDSGSIPELGRPLGVGNGTPPQYSCLENSMGRGAWQAIVHGVAKSQTRLVRMHIQNKTIENKETITKKQLRKHLSSFII